uniref:Reticulocalbin-3 n=1 Tax=Glossina brevipalpis TaxID=37001 RepID=A0A1A9WK75_9MUSC
MSTKFCFIVLCTVFVLMVNTKPTYSAGIAPHKHDKLSSKERLKDGIYHPRDVNHFDNGEHKVGFDHEAIIGNVKEAQEFDTLSPEESKRRLAVLIRLMDLNNDQYIDRHELKAWILRSFKKLAEEESADRFEEIDQDNNGQVTWKEYLEDTYAIDEEEYEKEVLSADGYEGEQELIRDDKEMFKAADLNKDDQLNLEEYTLFHNPEEHPHMLPIVLEQTMRQKDTNSDGKIDFREYVGDEAEQRDKEWLITEKERYDKDYDLNNDGVLIGNEVLSWVVPNNEIVATDEVDHLFASTDENHDNRLSYQEILDNYETFVGSEVTDYGDHLQNIHRLTDEL